MWLSERDGERLRALYIYIYMHIHVYISSERRVSVMGFGPQSEE